MKIEEKLSKNSFRVVKLEAEQAWESLVSFFLP